MPLNGGCVKIAADQRQIDLGALDDAKDFCKDLVRVGLHFIPKGSQWAGPHSDLVHVVEKDNASLRLLQVAIRLSVQLRDDAVDRLADVTSHQLLHHR